MNCKNCRKDIYFDGKRWMDTGKVFPQYCDGENEHEPERYMFNRFPNIGGDEPMLDTKFWKFLEENHEKEGIEYYTKAIQAYLSPRGFSIEKYYLPAEQVDIHKTVFGHFWWMKLREDKK